MQRHRFPSPNPQAELEPFESLEATDPLPIHQPAFAPQEAPDSQIAKPRTGMRQITNPQAQSRLILGPTPAIPGGAPKLR